MVYVTDDLGSSVIRLVFISSVINRFLCMTWMLETSDTTSRASGTGCRLNLCHHAQRPVSPLSRLASDRGYHVTRCRQRELCAQLLRLSLEPTQTVSMHAVGYVYH